VIAASTWQLLAEAKLATKAGKADTKQGLIGACFDRNPQGHATIAFVRGLLVRLRHDAAPIPEERGSP
jgi:hypothetical protein